MKFEKFKGRLSEGIRKRDLAWEIGLWILEGRVTKGITQEKLAKIVKTKQPSIARVENGSVLPSLRFLQKIAEALDLELPKFELNAKKSAFDSSSKAGMENIPVPLPTDWPKHETKTKSPYQKITGEIYKK